MIASLPSVPCERLPAPEYHDPASVKFGDHVYWPHKDTRPRVGLAVKSMERHMTDEGWQLFQGLESAGYLTINGRTGFGPCIGSNVDDVLRYWNPSTVVIQDKREWIGKTAGGPARGWDERERFRNVGALAERPDVFKVTVLKDAQSDRALHVEAAREAGIHAWICYYHPRIVAHLCPWVRSEHLVRTWHSVDAGLVPPFSAAERSGCLLSGALGLAYPLRTRLAHAVRKRKLQGVDWLPHPGYHRRGCATPDYLRTLSHYKVAICTSSVYGYALRKIVEATACGCIVITDLPIDEDMPGGVNQNLIRVHQDEDLGRFEVLVRRLCEDYDPEYQADLAERAKRWYDYRAVGRRLAEDIEALRRGWKGGA